MFACEKNAVREVVRFTVLGLFWGLFISLVYFGMVALTKQPLWMGLALALVVFASLFISTKAAKTMYWPLAVILLMVGLIEYGVMGAVAGLSVWFLILRIVPGLRYVLQRDNIVSVCSSTAITLTVVALIWRVSCLTGGQLDPSQWLIDVPLGGLIGMMFWGIAKIISSCLKECR